MLYKDWEKYYKKIIYDLKLNFEEDKDAASFLNSILKNKKLVTIKIRIL